MRRPDKEGHICIVVSPSPPFSLCSPIRPGALARAPWWFEGSESDHLFIHSLSLARARASPPLRQISVRKHDMRDVSLEETERYIVYVIDKVRGIFLTGKRSMDKMTCIIDLQRIAMRNLDGEGLKAILTVLQNYYPENLACMVFWKPPTIFWIVYKVSREQ